MLPSVIVGRGFTIIINFRGGVLFLLILRPSNGYFDSQQASLEASGSHENAMRGKITIAFLSNIFIITYLSISICPEKKLFSL